MAIRDLCAPIDTSERPTAKSICAGSASAHTTAAAGKDGIADHRGALCKSIGDGVSAGDSVECSVDCAQAQAPPSRRGAPAATHAPNGFGFLPLGMMARMIQRRGADGLGMDAGSSDAESSDEEDASDTDMGD